MDSLNYFSELNIQSNAMDNIKNKIAQAIYWKDFLDQSIVSLEVSDFNNDSAIVKLINDIGNPDRLSVFRFFPNTCYKWHFDTGRNASINIVVDGFDSMCLFGDPAPGNKFVNLTALNYKPNTYYLLNVKKFHSVYNFSNLRYVVSLGITDLSYQDIVEYLKHEKLL